MVRLAALLVLGISTALAVPLESFAPLPEVSPEGAEELISATSMDPYDFHSHEHHSSFGHSHTFGVTPKPFVPDEPSIVGESEAVPFVSATAETAPDTPFVSAEPHAKPGVSPEPSATVVNNTLDNVSEPFLFSSSGTAGTTAKVTSQYFRNPASPTVGSKNTRDDPLGINASPSVGSTNTRKPLIEGCVAIEHLQGYVLQHKQHLTRDVLCSGGFCATPNHAIIVDGVRTSMKQLCTAGWKCTESVKLVNNLKVWANRRAVINDSIIVTPYDVRFPMAAIWMFQVAEEMYNFVSNSIVMVTFVSFLLSCSVHAISPSCSKLTALQLWLIYTCLHLT